MAISSLEIDSDQSKACLAHSVRWLDGQMVRRSVSQSFCLSSSNFILVHRQADTGAESFFELTRVDNGIRFNKVYSSGRRPIDGAALCDIVNLFHLLTLD